MIKGEKRKLGEVLLEPTRIYVSSILNLLVHVKVHGLAHITGGGLSLNIPRILPKNLSCRINLKSWSRPPIFQWLQELGEVKEEEMLKTFNLGLGFVIILPPDEEKKAVKVLREAGEKVFVVGQVEKGSQEVIYEK
jgi:phosphoribosylformylglycinamidine cyclo-ligase